MTKVIRLKESELNTIMEKVIAEDKKDGDIGSTPTIPDPTIENFIRDKIWPYSDTLNWEEKQKFAKELYMHVQYLRSNMARD
jgi:hypothetical protein